MAKFISTTPPTQAQHSFEFSQRELDLLISILYDFVHDGAKIQFNDSAYEPLTDTREELGNILTAFYTVGMSVDNDYLSNFKEVVDG